MFEYGIRSVSEVYDDPEMSVATRTLPVVVISTEGHDASAAISIAGGRAFWVLARSCDEGYLRWFEPAVFWNLCCFFVWYRSCAHRMVTSRRGLRWVGSPTQKFWPP